eukprot:2599741-Rhodomonas_salina.2
MHSKCFTTSRFWFLKPVYLHTAAPFINSIVTDSSPHNPFHSIPAQDTMGSHDKTITRRVIEAKNTLSRALSRKITKRGATIHVAEEVQELQKQVGEAKQKRISVYLNQDDAQLLSSLRRMKEEAETSQAWTMPSHHSRDPDVHTLQHEASICIHHDQDLSHHRASQKMHVANARAHTTVMVRLPGASHHVQVKVGNSTPKHCQAHCALTQTQRNDTSSRRGSSWSELLFEVATKMKGEDSDCTSSATPRASVSRLSLNE